MRRKFLGWQEEWSSKDDLVVKGRIFNGRKTFYILWFKVYVAGFYHSTFME